MRLRTACRLFVLCSLLGVPASCSAQDSPLQSVEVSLRDYGIETPGAIQRGQLELYWGGEGPRLRVAHLRDAPPATLPLSVEAVPPPMGEDGCFSLEAASLSGINAFGGRFGAYSVGGSEGSAEIASDPTGRRVIALRCDDASPTSPCGLWMQLFDPAARIRSYVDAGDLEHLSMWIRTTPDDAEVVIKVADAAWERMEDSRVVASASEFVTGGASDRWRRLRMPLESLPTRLARDSLATLALEARSEGHSEVLVTGLRFCGPGGGPGPLPESEPREPSPDLGRKAVWIWRTRELIDDQRERARFLDFVAEEGFDHAFLQLVPPRGQRARDGFVPFDREGVAELVGELSRLGVATYATDGDPHYALPENHGGVVATVRGVAEYNREVAAGQRFEGVHYDIEPYLLGGFQGPRRTSLLQGFVTLVSAISREARGADLKLGVAVPFWLDSGDAYTGESFDAELDGATKPVLDHLVSLVDELAVMDYRTSAKGANGSVALVLGELEAAGKAGIGVWVGVETAPLVDLDLIDFAGPSEPGLPSRNGGSSVVLEPLGGDDVRIWLLAPGQAPLLEESLGDVDTAGFLHWAAGPAVRVAADSQTFHELGVERMRTEVGWMLTEVAKHPAFLGIAYHHYGTLRALKEGARP